MLRFLYYTALILGLYFIFKFFIKLLLYWFVVSSGKRFEKFYNGKTVKNEEEIEKTVSYKQKSSDEESEIIEFEEE